VREQLEALCIRWEREADEREDDALTYSGRDRQEKRYQEACTLRKCVASVDAILKASGMDSAEAALGESRR
jgi:hypothetical protein